MASSRRTSPLEGWLHLVSRLPWWAGVAIAALGYGVMHNMSLIATVTLTQPGQTAHFVWQTLLSTVGSIGQYLVPFVGLLGALMSYLSQRKRSALVDDVVRSGNPASFNEMSWLEFEQMVGEVFRHRGYQVRETGGVAADGGVDLVLTRNGGTYLVQCKQWTVQPVGVKIVRELKGVMAAQRAAGGWVVTSGVFTQEAVDFAKVAGIQLLDGIKLFSLSQQIRQQPLPITDTGAVPSAMARARPDPVPVLSPACPRCGETMTRRRARKGQNEGAYFWGCSTYPNCRGTRTME